MERIFYVIDLVDVSSRKYLGQALYCKEKEDCPYFAINDRVATGELFDAFVTGATEAGAEVRLLHVNMPLLIDSVNTQYNEIKKAVIKEMQTRIMEKQQQKQSE